MAHPQRLEHALPHQILKIISEHADASPRLRLFPLRAGVDMPAPDTETGRECKKWCESNNARVIPVPTDDGALGLHIIVSEPKPVMFWKNRRTVTYFVKAPKRDVSWDIGDLLSQAKTYGANVPLAGVPAEIAAAKPSPQATKSPKDLLF